MERRARFFTLDEANRTLPLVERIVGDIVECYGPFQADLEEFHRLATRGGADEHVERLTELRARIDGASDRINEFIRELHEIGCLFKGFEEGLVDFYALHRGEPIFLCWRLGEDRIGFWHAVDAGFAGRQPITSEMEAALRASEPVELDHSG